MIFAAFPRFSAASLFTEPISDGANTRWKGVSMHGYVRRVLWTGADGPGRVWMTYTGDGNGSDFCGDPVFCWVYHEIDRAFAPWGPNSELLLIKGL